VSQRAGISQQEAERRVDRIRPVKAALRSWANA
jgi:hypothetical protein